MTSTAVPLPFARKNLRRFPACVLPFAVAVLTLTLAMPGRAGSVDDLDRDYGLPDARLGTPLKAFQGLELVEDTGRWVTYKVPGNKLRYAGNEVTSIKYNFFKDALYSIDVTFDNRTTCKRLLKMFETNYGKNHTMESRRLPDTNTELETREWTGAKTYLVLKSAGDQRGGVAIFLDRPTWDQLAKPREEKAAQMRKLLNGSYMNADF